MLTRFIAGAIALACLVAPAQARHRHGLHLAPHAGESYGPIRCDNDGRCTGGPLPRASAVLPFRGGHAAGEIVAHPSGCPSTAFCGCGTAVEIFGAPIRSLWLAANWFRFPRAEPGPGMVAVRRHHVFAIREYRDGRALAYDPNSGGHLTRVHWVSLRGYTVVNPRGRS